MSGTTGVARNVVLQVIAGSGSVICCPPEFPVRAGLVSAVREDCWLELCGGAGRDTPWRLHRRLSGNATERLVDTARRHLDTWAQLRPDVEVEGVVLVVNHQISTYPHDRSTDVYSRPEFVGSLTIPVITALQLFHSWRQRDFAAIRTAVFGDTAQTPSAAGTDPTTASTKPQGRKARWRRRRG